MISQICDGQMLFQILVEYILLKLFNCPMYVYQIFEEYVSFNELIVLSQIFEEYILFQIFEEYTVFQILEENILVQIFEEYISYLIHG